MVEGLERRAPRPEGHRAGDPGRQDLRGGHRRRDHRRQRAVPGVQHQPGRRAAVPEAGRPRRARRLLRRDRLHRGALGRRRRPVQVAGREVLPDPVEAEPGDDLLQQGPVQEGRPRPGQARRWRRTTSSSPPARRSWTAAPPTPRSPRRRRASSSSPGSTSTRSTPRSPAASRRSRTARPPSTTPAGKDVWNFWAQMYKDGYSPKEKYNGDSFADKKAAMAVVGPWAIAVYKDKVNWGVVPVPDQGRHGRRARSTPSPTPRTSASTRPARTRRPRGTC